MIRPESKYLTLAMLNGDNSTRFDDIALRDVDLYEFDGELPELPSEQEREDAAQGVTEDLAANLPRSM